MVLKALQNILYFIFQFKWKYTVLYGLYTIILTVKYLLSMVKTLISYFT